MGQAVPGTTHTTAPPLALLPCSSWGGRSGCRAPQGRPTSPLLPPTVLMTIITPSLIAVMAAVVVPFGQGPAFAAAPLPVTSASPVTVPLHPFLPIMAAAA